jgi:RNA polymerase sigma-70 factor, ECF subfamily
MVNGLAYRLIGRDSDVDDLVQDSFIEAFSHLGRLREPQAFAGWLRSILVHRTGKLLRRRRLLERFGLGRGSLDFDPEVIVSRSAPTDVAAELRAVYARIQKMPAHLRIALVLRKVEGHSLEEVAELTGTSLATVKRRLEQANSHLKAVKESR